VALLPQGFRFSCNQQVARLKEVRQKEVLVSWISLPLVDELRQKV
jgi:hypothetical protein